MFKWLRREKLPEPVTRTSKGWLGTCTHGWDFNEKGQCPKCASGALQGINWSLVDKEAMESLSGLITAAKKDTDMEV